MSNGTKALRDDTRGLLVLKTLGYRALAMLAMVGFGVAAWAFTGDSRFAGFMFGAELVKVVFYYAYERLWQRLRARRQVAGTLEVADA